MKKTLLIFLILLGIKSSMYSQSSTIQTIINQTNLDSLIYFVKELSGEVQTIIGGSPYTIVSRHKNQPSNNMAANYIKQKLGSYGLPTYDQWWSSTGRNVSAVQLGTTYPNKKYIINAGRAAVRQHTASSRRRPPNLAPPRGNSPATPPATTPQP